MYVCVRWSQPTCGYLNMNTHQRSGDLAEYGAFVYVCMYVCMVCMCVRVYVCKYVCMQYWSES